MLDERLPKKAFYGELREGNAKMKRYKDILKALLKDFNIATKSWVQAT